MSHAWGLADEISVATGMIVMAAGMAIPKNRTRERAALLLANGIALGPLLLIMLSPVVGYFSPNMDLLEIAMSEGKATVFWAAAYASIQLVRDIL